MILQIKTKRLLSGSLFLRGGEHYYEVIFFYLLSGMHPFIFILTNTTLKRLTATSHRF